MTNAEIILKNRIFLMEQEVIKGIPGTCMTVEDEQGKREVLIPEEIHTFEEWKKMGFMVQRGEHAVAKFQIWMPSKKKSKAAEQDEEQKEEGALKGFYKKVAFFFTAEQVKKLAE